MMLAGRSAAKPAMAGIAGVGRGVAGMGDYDPYTGSWSDASVLTSSSGGSSGYNWGSFLSDVTKGSMSILSSILTPATYKSTTTTSATGSSATTTELRTATAASLANTLAGKTTSVSLTNIAVIGFAAVFAIMMAARRR
jgi:hypothetical protein